MKWCSLVILPIATMGGQVEFMRMYVLHLVLVNYATKPGQLGVKAVGYASAKRGEARSV